MKHPVDTLAAAGAISSPAWAGLLSDINGALTAVSLTLGILFLLWRWRRAYIQDRDRRDGDF